MTHSESSILKMLHYKYFNTAKYKVSNIFVFKDDWESDFFIVQKSSGYCYEIEVKVSVADFRSDFKKKAKHQILASGSYDHTGWNKSAETREHDFRPNKFYYCVPEGMISVKDLPTYAGLMYATESGIRVVKEPGFIHREVLNFESKLCYKFYLYWVKEKQDRQFFRSRIDDLERQLFDLTSNAAP